MTLEKQDTAKAAGGRLLPLFLFGQKISCAKYQRYGKITMITKLCTKEKPLEFEQTIRVGDKIISIDRAVRVLEQVLRLRSQGLSQQEVARRLSLDRSFVSRLEAIGEIRKGRRVAVIGFPIENKQELIDISRERGLDFTFILSNQERWSLVSRQKALDFFNQVMEIISSLKEYDTLILITSERWYRLAEALLDLQIIFVNLGSTPVQENRRVDPVLFKQTLQDIV